LGFGIVDFGFKGMAHRAERKGQRAERIGPSVKNAGAVGRKDRIVDS